MVSLHIPVVLLQGRDQGGGAGPSAAGAARLIVPVILIYAAAFGAYQAVDWALALKVLPSAEAAGKDMGIWRISMVLPQILGPAVTGGMISALKVSFCDPTAYATAFGTGALWLMLSAALVTRVRLPVPTVNKILTY